MNDEYSSGAGGTAITIRHARDTQPPTRQVNDELSLDVTGSLPPGITTTSSARSVRRSGPPGRTSGKESPRAERAQHQPEARDAIRRYWRDAQQRATDMISAARAEDLIGLSNSASDLDHLLEDMWNLRECREMDWRGVLNSLQGVLKYVWKIEGGFERLTVDQCKAILEVITNHLGPATIDSDDVRSTLKILRRGGFDPWIVISGDPQE
jgi:hypothetical protein